MSPDTPMQQRLWLLQQAAQNPNLQALLRERCRRDIVFWFNQFCWTFDPRKPQPVQPFTLYPYQVQTVFQLQQHIRHGHDLLIEKSRDMGVSWMILLVFQHGWLFEAGSHFLVGSRKADMVDQKGDLSTLLEKLRFNLYRLPHWMQPAPWTPRTHDTVMKLINPANGNTILGESTNPQFSRGGRFKAIFLDEFPFWPNDHQAFAASGQSSPCRLVVGTPYGKHNKFAQLRFESPIPRLRLHWRLHPEKDDGWYQQETQRMSADEIARELDINYHLSVSNRVFNEFTPDHITPDLLPMGGIKVIRSWDFGYHCPACVLLQVDSNDRLLVLYEIVGRQEQLTTFAQRVLTFCSVTLAGFEFEDLCDPAGAQKSDKSTRTSIEILNSLGIFPFYNRSRIADGIELIRRKLTETLDDHPALLVSERCTQLIEAFQGGYRFARHDAEKPLEEHPYEDVMDCLRYAVIHKCGIPANNQNRRPLIQKPQSTNPYTGYSSYGP